MALYSSPNNPIKEILGLFSAEEFTLLTQPHIAEIAVKLQQHRPDLELFIADRLKAASVDAVIELLHMLEACSIISVKLNHDNRLLIKLNYEYGD